MLIETPDFERQRSFLPRQIRGFALGAMQHLKPPDGPAYLSRWAADPNPPASKYASDAEGLGFYSLS